MQLVTVETLVGEIAHHYESATGDYIFSRVNRFWGSCRGSSFSFEVPLAFWKITSTASRLSRRFLRTDKSNAVFNYERNGIVVLYDGRISFYDIARARFQHVGRLRQSRNVLHQGIAVTESGMFFGEYGHNAERASVPIWASYDGGRSWRVVFEFDAGSIKHIHGVYHDPFGGKLWVATGDFAGECCIVCADPKFDVIERLGDGSQRWRAVSMLFEEDAVLLPMDSPLEPSRLQLLDRRTKTLTTIQTMDSPVWYTKRLSDGIGLLQTTVEIGEGVVSNHSQIHASYGLSDWNEIARYKKDRWPMPWFKFGSIGFADGSQKSDDFVIFGEGLNDIDGRILRVRLD